MLETLEIILWYSVIIIGYTLMVLFFKQYLKRESLQKPFFLGLTLFTLSYSTARLIENIRRYSIGSYNDIFDAWVAGTQITGVNFWTRVIGYYVIAWFGIALMFYSIEKNIFKNNKFILTIASIFEGIVSIVNYFYLNPVTFVLATIFFFVIMFMPIMFLNLAHKTPPGSIRNASLFIALGIFLFAAAVMMDLPEMAYIAYSLNQTTPEAIIRIVAPILLIVGIIVLWIGFQRFFPKD